jgi:hypothetical protein
MDKLTLESVEFRPLQRNTLVGFAAIRIPAMRPTILDVALHTNGEARWAELPSKAQLRDGMLVRNEQGKTQYAPVLEFDTPSVRNAFSQAAVHAVLEYDPQAFDVEAVS